MRRLLGWLIAVSLLAAPAAATTFDTFDTDAAATVGVTFSNGNLTALGGASAAASSAVAQSLEGKKSGKYYVEFTVVVVNANIDGIGVTASWGIGQNWIGKAQASAPDSGWAYYSNANVIHSGVAQTAVNNTTFVATDVIAEAIDLDNGRIWWRKNGGSWIGSSGTPNPATNTGGFDISKMLTNSSRVYPAVNLSGSTSKYTANFGATAFAGTVPSGFTSGWSNTTAGTYFGTFASNGHAGTNSSAPIQNAATVSCYTSNFTGPLAYFIIAYAGTSQQDVKGLVFDATGVGGLPGNLLGVSTNIVNNAGPNNYGETAFNFTGVNLVSGASYCFGAISDVVASSVVNTVLPVSVTNGLISKANTYASPTSPFGASPTIGTFRIPMLIFPGAASSICSIASTGSGPC